MESHESGLPGGDTFADALSRLHSIGVEKMNINPYETTSKEKDSSGKCKAVKSAAKRRVAVSILAIHSCCVLSFAFMVHSELKRSGEAAMGWMIWLILDFPVSIGIVPFEALIRSTPVSYHVLYTVFYGLYFLILGGLQYYFLGFWIAGFLIKDKKSGSENDVMTDEKKGADLNNGQ